MLGTPVPGMPLHIGQDTSLAAPWAGVRRGCVDKASGPTPGVLHCARSEDLCMTPEWGVNPDNRV